MFHDSEQRISGESSEQQASPYVPHIYKSNDLEFWVPYDIHALNEASAGSSTCSWSVSRLSSSTNGAILPSLCFWYRPRRQAYHIVPCYLQGQIRHLPIKASPSLKSAFSWVIHSSTALIICSAITFLSVRTFSLLVRGDRQLGLPELVMKVLERSGDI